MKSRSFFSTLFSPRIAGLDIADQTVRFVILDPSETGYTVAQYGSVSLPEGVIVNGSIANPKKLTDILKQIRKTHGIRHVHVSLPKSHAFIVENAGMIPHDMVMRAEALARVVAPSSPYTAMMLVTFGDTQIDVAVIHDGRVYHARSVSIPGNITDVIRQALGTTIPETLTVKRSIGLSRKSEHEHIFDVFQPIAAELSKIIDSHFIDWHTQTGEKRPKITEVVLTGANAHIAGLSEFLQSSLRTDVSLADPWLMLTTDDTYVPPLHRDESLAYATALGLAIGNR